MKTVVSQLSWALALLCMACVSCSKHRSIPPAPSERDSSLSADSSRTQRRRHEDLSAPTSLLDASSAEDRGLSTRHRIDCFWDGSRLHFQYQNLSNIDIALLRRDSPSTVIVDGLPICDRSGLICVSEDFQFSLQSGERFTLWGHVTLTFPPDLAFRGYWSASRSIVDDFVFISPGQVAETVFIPIEGSPRRPARCYLGFFQNPNTLSASTRTEFDAGESFIHTLVVDRPHTNCPAAHLWRTLRAR